MSIFADPFEKVTVSLGGPCPLRCSHCYTATRQFRPGPRQTIEQVLSELQHLQEPFSVICVSGDADCFVDQDAGWQLISRLALQFESTDIMFTSRLVPKESIADSMVSLGHAMSMNKRLLIPCISVVTVLFPNGLENPVLVPPTKLRLDFMHRLAQSGLPCFLTVRPTFPFGVISKTEVEDLISTAAGSAVAVLGEAMILDLAGEIATRLGITSVISTDAVAPLSFLDQPTSWNKALFHEEIEFARAVSEKHGLPFFLRSMSAVKYLRAYWDFEHSVSTYRQGDPIDRSLDSFLP